MDAPQYVRLPATGDDGFPQAFLLAFGGAVYRLTFTVLFSDPRYVLDGEFESDYFELPDAGRGLFLELRVEREDLPDPLRLLAVRRVVLDVPAAFGPLLLRFRRVRVARRNLIGPGRFGSELLAEVAANDV